MEKQKCSDCGKKLTHEEVDADRDICFDCYSDQQD